MWNASVYNQFKKERIQPSIDLLSRVEKSQDECQRILDIGCGSGMSTYPLRKRYEKAQIVGVDLSQEMLNQAKTMLSDVEWMQRDCSESLTDLGTFDLVFSNAFIQWLTDQEQFIKNAKELMNSNAVFALQVPSFEERTA